MMKTTLFVTSLLLSVMVNLPAQASVSTSDINSTVAKICQNTADDDRLGLLHTLKEHHISRKAAVTKVVCNGQPLLDFARAEQANKVVKLLEPTERRLRGTVTIQDVTATP